MSAHAVICLEEIDPNTLNVKLFVTLRNNCNITFTSHIIYIFGTNLGKALYSLFVYKGLSLY